MRILSASELVELWERGLGQHPVDRALTLLAACSAEPRHDLAALTIGQRDRRLLEMHERLFGPELSAFAECPDCGEHLEYRLSTHDLSLPAGAPHDAADLTLVAGEVTMRLRLPDSVDLGAVSQCTDIATARTMLMERCIVSVSRGGRSLPVSTLCDSALDRVAARLAELDPQADLLIDLTCSARGHRWQVVLDIECFLWVKISALARRLLREVHILARAYGWRESDILALSAIRRQCYLDMVSP